jgi:diaminopimelate decarboxylase
MSLTLNHPQVPVPATGSISSDTLEKLAREVGTPFWTIDATVLRQRIQEILAICKPAGVQPRFAMKSLSHTLVLQEMVKHGVWIDAVSGNEALRGIRAGAKAGHCPPEVLLTADVFRDNALEVAMKQDLLVNVGSPGMIRQLAQAGFQGPVALRLNPGFGHGHVNSCDTGGPSSKHGIWWTDGGRAAEEARAAGLKIVMIHAHIGSGPKMEELVSNLRRLASEFASIAHQFPDLEAVSLGGGFPHTYREDHPPVDPTPLADLFVEARSVLEKAAGRSLRMEIEPGRYFVAPSCTLTCRVQDVKSTQKNEKGDGRTFVMVDAGFVDLIRPAMYGSYHRITVPGRENHSREPLVIAGPLCESGDVFTRGADDTVEPRLLPRPEAGDLLCIHDGGAYGYVMASNYNSIGRAPQIWIEEDGSARLISRRENLEDVLKAETDQALPL